MEAIADAQWLGMDERPSARIGADIHHFRFDPSQALKLHAGAIACSPTTLTWRSSAKVRSRSDRVPSLLVAIPVVPIQVATGSNCVAFVGRGPVDLTLQLAGA